MIGLGAVEAQVRQALGIPKIELVAINLPDEKKGERILLLADREMDYEQLRKATLTSGANPLMIPSEAMME